MRIKIYSFCIYIVIAIVVLSSCRYEEGPVVSFRSAEKRLLGDWEVKKLTINDIDCTYSYFDKCNCIFHFNTDPRTSAFAFNNCDPDLRDIHGSYYWKKNTHHTMIEIKTGVLQNYFDSTLDNHSPITYFGPVGNQKESEWEILKLKYTELKILSIFEGNKYIIECRSLNH